MRRARRSGSAASVLSVEDAIVWLRQTFEPTAVELPHIIEREAYAVDKHDALFDSLRADYPGFDHWFDEKCAKEHRKCWIVDGLVVLWPALSSAKMRRGETASCCPLVRLLNS